MPRIQGRYTYARTIDSIIECLIDSAIHFFIHSFTAFVHAQACSTNMHAHCSKFTPT